MIRLVFADLTSTKAVWGGLLAIAVVFGYLGSWAVSIESTASQFDNLKNLGTVVVLFSSIAGVSLLVPLAQQAVSLKAKTYALWQIVGASPRTIRLIVLMQLFAIAIVGAAGGSAFEVLSSPCCFHWFLAHIILRAILPLIWVYSTCLLSGLVRESCLLLAVTEPRGERRIFPQSQSCGRPRCLQN